MAEIRLTKGLVALVDEEDAQRVLAAGSWCADIAPHTAYARRGRTRLHTFITGWSFVDHINGNGLDNRKSNLRQASHATNAQNIGPKSNNTSGFKGVTWDKRAGKWMAQIQKNRRSTFLGYYADPADAAKAYDSAAREMHGEFARTNFTEQEVA